MRAFNFYLLAVFSYIAVIGATPLGARAPAEAIGYHQLPDCDRRDDPLCGEFCNYHPSDPICVTRCFARPESSYCSKVCDVDPRWSFCRRKSSTTDQSPLQLCLT